MTTRNPLVMVSGLVRELPAVDVLALGNVTPASVAATGTVTGSNLSGTNTGDQTTVSGNSGTATKLVTARSIAMTGDVAWSIAAFDGSANVTAAGTIGANVVTFPKLVAATQAAFVGSTAAGNFGELTPTQATAQLNAFTSALKGLVPLSGGGTTNFLRADGTWAATGGGSGTVTSVSIVTAGGVSGTVATATTTPAITLTLGAITPTSVAATGTVAGSNLSGTNTGDQTSVSGNAGTATALATGQTLAITGDLVWTSPTFNGSANITAAGVLATVNASVGTYGGATAVPIITVNGKGLVTGVSTATLGPWATFMTPTATVLNPGPNLVYNSTFALNFLGWTTAGGGSWASSSNVASYTTPAAIGSGTLTSDFFSTPGSGTYFLSVADAAFNTTRTIVLLAYDNGFVPARVPANDVTFTPGINNYNRGGATVTLNQGTYKLQITVNNATATAGYYYNVKNIKIELGSYMSSWTDEATNGAVYRYNDGTGTLLGSTATLPLGNAATKTTGTSGANVPLLNTANTWSSAQTFGGAVFSNSATAGVGYSTGAGGVVTQLTSKATGVTLNTVSGAITMNGVALAASTAVSFTLTNSAIAATDVLILSIKSGATAGAYRASIDAVAAGSATVTLRNLSAGSLSEAVVINFAVIKAVSA